MLKQREVVFRKQKGLPPKRERDHSILLKTNVDPPNIRPYRIPHHQKDAMEYIIKQLLESEKIRVSVSPYSSPAVMVRKKRWLLEDVCGL